MLQILDRIKDQKDRDLIVQIYDYLVKTYNPEVIINTQNYFGVKNLSKYNQYWLYYENNSKLVLKARKDANIIELDGNFIKHQIDSFEVFLRVIESIPMIVINSNRTLVETTTLDFFERKQTLEEKVMIYSIGSCNFQNKNGSYTAILEYKDNFKVIRGSLKGTTSNRCIIQGIIESIKSIKKPSELIVVTSTLIGIKKGLKGKGPNHDLIRDLIDSIELKKCTVQFFTVKGHELNKYMKKVEDSL